MSVSDAIYHDIQPNSPPVEKSFHFLFFDPEFIIFFESEGEYHRLFKIDISAKFWMESEIIPVNKAIRYSSGNEIYAERVDYSWKVSSGDELTLSIQRDLEKKNQNALFFVKSNFNSQSKDKNP